MKLSDVAEDTGKTKLSDISEDAPSQPSAPEPEERGFFHAFNRAIGEVVPNIGEAFSQGFKQSKKGMEDVESAIDQPNVPAMAKQARKGAVEALGGGLAVASAPFTGIAKTAGDVARRNIPKGTPGGEFAANTIEDAVGMVGGGPFVKMAGEAARIASTGARYASSAAEREAARAIRFKDKASDIIAKKFHEDAAGGGVSAQDAIDLVDQARKRGKPAVLADKATPGGNVDALTGTSVRGTGPAKARINTELANRDKGAGPRIDADLKGQLGDASALDARDILYETRSKGAKPLFDDAMRGGSIAPLGGQIQAHVAETTAQVQEASNKVTGAMNRVKRLVEKSGGASDFYVGRDAQARAPANDAKLGEEIKAAQAELDAAHRELDQAHAANKSARDMWTKVQADKSAGVPGAIWSPRLQQFMDDPVVKNGLSDALLQEKRRAIARNEPFVDSDYAIKGYDKDGKPIIGQVPTMKLLAVGKEHLDGFVAAHRDSITGRLDKEGEAAAEFRDAYVKELDKLNPKYAEARNYWSGKSSSLDAIEWGKKLYGMDIDAVSRDWARMSENEREFAKVGLSSMIRQRVKDVGFAGNEALTVIKSQGVKERLMPLFKSEAEFNKFAASIEDEADMFRTKARNVGGSPTAGRVADDKLANASAAVHGAAAVGHAATGNALASVAHSVIAAARKLGGRGGPELNDAVAKILFDPNITETSLFKPKEQNIGWLERIKPTAGTAAAGGLASVHRQNQ